MKWILKRLTPLLAILYISITIFRVSSFAAGNGNFAWQILSLIFATGLALSVLTCSFFAGYDATRRPATIGLIFFVLVDGYFNFVETLMWSVGQGRWDQTIEFAGQQFYSYRIADIIYGIFPTLAAAMLGYLSRYAVQIQDSKPKGLWKEARAFFISLIAGEPEYGAASIAQPDEKNEKPEWLGDARPETKKDFLKLVKAGKIIIPEQLRANELARHTPVSVRSAQDWLRDARRISYERQISSLVQEQQAGSGYNSGHQSLPAKNEAGAEYNRGA
jgi:hypothetical protein